MQILRTEVGRVYIYIYILKHSALVPIHLFGGFRIHSGFGVQSLGLLGPTLVTLCNSSP